MRMAMRRVVPDVHTTPDRMAASVRFYRTVLGMDVGMDMGWIVGLGSPDNETAQIQLLSSDATAPVVPDVSIEVGDLDAVHRRALEAGHEIVYPITREPWGVRRFFVRDPNGVVINVMTHDEGS
jgi:catechol 2,3-dioxygenase-like lactoylglutathione lyase family enzyme